MDVEAEAEGFDGVGVELSVGGISFEVFQEDAGLADGVLGVFQLNARDQ